MSKSTYSQNLISRVMDYSNAIQWDEAVLEWEITNWDEDEDIKTSCICGKENIRYLFTIENQVNGNVLEPIGSKCIQKFNRKDLNKLSNTYEKLFKLKKALKDNRYIGLSSEFFSRDLLQFFYDAHILDSDYNEYNGESDYIFLLEMFNKRKKSSITAKQNRKINAIIIYQIIPYLNELLE
ncbi:hypothetical protein [Proteiniclasticum ruminis]|uniref:Uncharacterized protein n=1 Tax=Proteiniclasticum ruminis TaxID=398199 RepID=A0A1G8GHK6_9CLOT|nr:hypothetical protein [Proteiniclasticum ruminis]SDH93868.1 hypothetical protein SAMN05421804_101267 [Proteiniclasticum ruminis]